MFLGTHSIRKIDPLAVHIFHPYAYGKKKIPLLFVLSSFYGSLCIEDLMLLLTDKQPVDQNEARTQPFSKTDPTKYKIMDKP
jgi:hypothetical protein